jgi:hypothetical protein
VMLYVILDSNFFYNSWGSKCMFSAWFFLLILFVTNTMPL